MLNIAMGKLANTINFENRFHSKNKSRSFESAIVELIIGGAWITVSAGAVLQRAYKGDAMRTELIKTNDWDKELFDIIDWDAFGIAFREMNLSDRIQISKMAHGILPIMRQQLLFEYATFDFSKRATTKKK